MEKEKKTKAYEYVCRMVKQNAVPRVDINRIENLIEFCRGKLGLHQCPQECFYIFYINTEGMMTGYELISKGSLFAAKTQPSNIFRGAMAVNAANILLLHTHPQAKAIPSAADDLVTSKITAFGKSFGINVCDHVIIGEDDYFSYRKEKRIIGETEGIAMGTVNIEKEFTYRDHLCVILRVNGYLEGCVRTTNEDYSLSCYETALFEHCQEQIGIIPRTFAYEGTSIYGKKKDADTWWRCFEHMPIEEERVTVSDVVEECKALVDDAVLWTLAHGDEDVYWKEVDQIIGII